MHLDRYIRNRKGKISDGNFFMHRQEKKIIDSACGVL